MPSSLGALPLLKEDVKRIFYYMDKFGIVSGLPDTSLHFHISRTLFDGEAGVEDFVTELLWFFFENPEFIQTFSNRTGSGKDLANIRWYLGDPLEEKTDEALKRDFMLMKRSGLELLRDKNQISQSDKIQAFKSDTRAKGFLNIVINDEHDTIEVRWCGDPKNTNEFMQMKEFFHLMTEWLPSKPISTYADLNSGKRFAEYVASPLNRIKYPHLFNAILEYPYLSIYIEDKKATEIIETDIESVLNFTSYDEVIARFQESRAEQFRILESLLDVYENEFINTKTANNEILENNIMASQDINDAKEFAPIEEEISGKKDTEGKADGDPIVSPEEPLLIPEEKEDSEEEEEEDIKEDIECADCLNFFPKEEINQNGLCDGCQEERDFLLEEEEHTLSYVTCCRCGDTNHKSKMKHFADDDYEWACEGDCADAIIATFKLQPIEED